MVNASNSRDIARLEERLAALSQLTEERFTLSARAILKAETATEKRFESVNEFRGALVDAAARHATRENVELMFNSLRDQVTASTGNNRKVLDENIERTRLELIEVRAQATRLLLALLTTVIGTLVAALVVAWSNHT